MDYKDGFVILFGIIAILSVTFAHFALNEQKVLVVPDNFQMDIYNVTMINNCSFNRLNETIKMGNGSLNCSGWTDNKNNIYLMQNMSKRDLKITCNHEAAHNLIKGMNNTREEEIVEEIDEYLNFSVCNW